MHEYVPALTERTKWSQKRRNLNVGDVVLLVESTQPRGKWLLGRVQEEHKGKDGVIRSANVKTKLGNFVRPTNKTCVIAECPAST